MGLKSSIQAMVNSAVTSSLGDLASAVVLRSTTTGSYDTTTGAITTSVVLHECTGVLSSLTQKDVVDLSIIATGRKVLIPALQLLGVDVDSLDDELSIDGVLWNIVSVNIDPAAALYTFIVNARSGVKLRAD